MENIFNRLTACIERGRIDRNSPFPPDLKGQDGAAELTAKLLLGGVPASEILQKALMVGMSSIGDKFSRGEAFIPELLISARAMKAAMNQLQPYFESGEAEHCGTLVIGTVQGDLHDIGKRIVGMVAEGDGWKVIDIGSNAPSEKFVETVRKYPQSVVGISALLATTMLNMEETVRTIKSAIPGTRVYVGGAPLTERFNRQIGADGYFPEPYSFVKHLRESVQAHL